MKIVVTDRAKEQLKSIEVPKEVYLNVAKHVSKHY